MSEFTEADKIRLARIQKRKGEDYRGLKSGEHRDSRSPIPIQQRLIWRADEVGIMLGMHRQTVAEMHRYEKLPSPLIMNNHHVCWRADEIRDWVKAGAPHRRNWVWEPTVLPTLRKATRDARAELAEVQSALKASRAQLNA